MATPVTGGTVWLFTVNWIRSSQRLMTTCMLTDTSITDFTDYEAFASGFLTAQVAAGGFVNRCLPILSESVVMLDCRMQPIYPTRYTPMVEDGGGLVAGALTGQTLPVNSAMTITKRSVFATRWGIGSMHLPAGVASSQGASSTWASGIVTDAGELGEYIAGEWTQPDGSHDMRAILWNKAMPSRKTLVSGFTVQPTVRVERRRTVGVGI